MLSVRNTLSLFIFLIFGSQVSQLTFAANQAPQSSSSSSSASSATIAAPQGITESIDTSEKFLQFLKGFHAKCHNLAKAIKDEDIAHAQKVFTELTELNDKANSACKKQENAGWKNIISGEFTQAEKAYEDGKAELTKLEGQYLTAATNKYNTLIASSDKDCASLLGELENFAPFQDKTTEEQKTKLIKAIKENSSLLAQYNAFTRTIAELPGNTNIHQLIALNTECKDLLSKFNAHNPANSGYLKKLNEISASLNQRISQLNAEDGRVATEALRKEKEDEALRQLGEALTALSTRVEELFRNTNTTEAELARLKGEFFNLAENFDKLPLEDATNKAKRSAYQNRIAGHIKQLAEAEYTAQLAAAEAFRKEKEAEAARRVEQETQAAQRQASEDARREAEIAQKLADEQEAAAQAKTAEDAKLAAERQRQDKEAEASFQRLSTEYGNLNAAVTGRLNAKNCTTAELMELKTGCSSLAEKLKASLPLQNGERILQRNTQLANISSLSGQLEDAIKSANPNFFHRLTHKQYFIPALLAGLAVVAGLTYGEHQNKMISRFLFSPKTRAPEQLFALDPLSWLDSSSNWLQGWSSSSLSWLGRMAAQAVCAQ